MNRNFNTCLAICILFPFILNGQTIGIKKAPSTTSYKELQDSAVKKEISCFIMSASQKKKLNNLKKSRLSEVFPWKCSDTLISFNKGNIIGMNLNVSIFISKFDSAGYVLTYEQNKLKLIDSSNFWSSNLDLPKKRINMFNVYFGEYRPNAMPYNAFNDLFDPETCPGSIHKNKTEPSTCRVFRSSDNKKVYIYMLNGQGTYEVTFVFINAKYVMRVIDRIN